MSNIIHSDGTPIINPSVSPANGKPTFIAAPILTTTTGLFDGESATSEDFIINLWAEGDPYELYPIDIVTYFKLLGRTVAIRDQYEEGDLRTRAEIKEGIETLKRAKEDGKGLFYEVGHQFPEAAFKKFPHFPYIYGVDVNRLGELLHETAVDYNGNWDSYEIDRTALILSKVRHPVPNDLKRHPGHPMWDDFIGTLYSAYNPIPTRERLWGAAEWGILFYNHQFLASGTGSTPPVYPNDLGDEAEIESDDEYGHTDDEEMTQFGTVTIP